MQEESKYDEPDVVPGVEGVTIHISPMSIDGPEPNQFIVRIAVNGRVLEPMTWFGVPNDAVPRTVADLLQKGATEYARQRPGWAKRAAAMAAVGAFRNIFRKKERA